MNAPWAPAPFRVAFDNARDPYTARNALGITASSGGGVTSATPPLSISGGVISIDLSGYQPIDGDLTAISALTGTNTIYYRSGTSTWTPVVVGTGLTFTGGTLAATAVTGGAWIAYTPTLAAGSGTLTSAAATGRYIQIGQTVSFSIRVAITTNGTAGGYITATLPVTAFAASQALSGYHETNTEVMSAVILSTAQTVVQIRNSAGEYPGANGAAFVVSGTYEASLVPLGSTWNPVDKSANMALSNGDLTATCTVVGNTGVRATSSKTTGKLYFEVTTDATGTANGGNTGVGIASSSANLDFVASSALNGAIAYFAFGAPVYYNGSASGKTTGSDATAGDVYCVAVDMTNKRLWARKNGGNWFNDAAADPATNTNGLDISSVFTSNAAFALVTSNSTTPHLTANFGASAFAQTMPSGFSAWG